MTFLKQVVGIAIAAVVIFGGYQLVDDWLEPDSPARDARAARGPSAIPVELAVARASPMERTLEAVGTTRAQRSVEIVPLASGRVTELSFESGEKVEKGEALLHLDDDIEAANLKEAEAKRLEAARALERAASLRESKTVTAATLETLTAASVTAEAELARAQRRLDDRTVRAPFGGITGLKRVDLGARVDDQTVVTTLDDLSSVEVEFALPETVFGEVKTGLPVRAESVAFPGRDFSGKIVAIDSRVDGTSRSFKVRAAIPNSDLALPAGMFMNLAVVLEKRVVVLVPEEAVMAEGEGSFLFVADGETARRRLVEIGQRRSGMVEVAEGLSDGEKVVTRGIQQLRDGSQIRPIKDAAEPEDGSGGLG
ncbi:efflux RND transporter periplasmic adaptor subunit [Afifella sp. IM 167]|uniref:efflux RND transporter periplasmic adaptor subunit n=1 Tax=Afifella sp. IM 167 TaxID=2033586 RepID=UPI001CCBEB17|nr:efflux RND transporter periplasmic adaptor subunit [Afifella sp. IM 167]MBZ8132096.1 efflux transporter periplasmic adaptor subunit [Afifella sp. IM 167]